MVGTALAALVAAALAFAGNNTYTATLHFSPNRAGKPKRPVPTSCSGFFTSSGQNGNRAAPLTDIKSTVYGLKATFKGFPTCREAKIAAAKSDAGCPKKAMAASGYLTAVIGPTSGQSQNAQGTGTCDPLLHVWNGGGGELVFFLIEQPPNHECAGGAITTGAVPPWEGRVSYRGKFIVLDLPIPRSVSFPLSGIEASFERSFLKWVNGSTEVHGRKIHDITSIGCRNAQRPYSVSFTSEEAGGAPQTDTVTGRQACR
jgi:hypothetical protein